MSPRSNPGAAAPPSQPAAVHTGDIAGVATRFYLPPSGKPEMPWVAFPDVNKIGKPEDRQRRSFMDRVDRNVVLIHEGQTSTPIIPHWLAAEYLRSAAASGTCDFATLTEFKAESSAALNEIAKRQPEGSQLAFRNAALGRLRQQLTGE